MSKVYLSSDIQSDSIVDGPGLRAVVWFQGCSHKCPGCHNPETHEFNIGLEYDTADIFKMIDQLENQDGITYSGGDPMFQPMAFLEILKYAKSKGYNNLCYTGFTYSELKNMGKIYLDILNELDILIDSKFDINLKSLNAKYRGSTNQKVIDLNSTRKTGVVTYLYEEDFTTV